MPWEHLDPSRCRLRLPSRSIPASSFVFDTMILTSFNRCFRGFCTFLAHLLQLLLFSQLTARCPASTIPFRNCQPLWWQPACPTSPSYLFDQVLLVCPSRTFSISHIFLAFAMEVS